MKANALFSLKPKPDISGLIKRRRRQLLVHSYIYYELNQNIISDDQWSKWALELEKLQAEHPELASKVEFADIFKNFDHSTGQNLRSAYMQPNIMDIAMRLLEYRKGG